MTGPSNLCPKCRGGRGFPVKCPHEDCSLSNDPWHLLAGRVPTDNCTFNRAHLRLSLPRIFNDQNCKHSIKKIMVPYTITHQPSPDDNGYVSAVGAKLTAGQPHCLFSTLKLNVREVPPKKCSKGPFTGRIRKLQRLALVNVILPWNILASKKS